MAATTKCLRHHSFFRHHSRWLEVMRGVVVFHEQQRDLSAPLRGCCVKEYDTVVGGAIHVAGWGGNVCKFFVMLCGE